MIETALAFLFGLLIGSFLNVCIYRWTRGLSVVRPRSACPACGKMIAWYDNVPLVSFALLKRHCRHCGAPISWRYPVIELLTGIAVAGAVFRFGVTPAALKIAVFASICIALVATDLADRLLPDYFTIGGTVIGILFALVDGDSRVLRSLFEALAGAALPSFGMWCLGELYYLLRKREGIALGDVKMIAMIGAFLGLRGSLLVLVIGSVSGAVIGLIYVLLARKSAATYPIPFGVFLGAAAIIVAWFGEPLMRTWPSPSGVLLLASCCRLIP